MPKQMPDSVSESVRAQYEKHPYPPIHWAQLPQAQQWISLKLEHYVDTPARVQNARILVLGCGTLEPLLVAEQNRGAAQITAVDLSSRSIDILRKRERLYRVATLFRKRPTLELVCADFLEWGEGRLGDYDFVIASNVLHHLEDPARGMARAAQFLKPGGLLRMVTYPKMSRIWMRAGTDHFRRHGITGAEKDLRARCAAVILQLPLEHPVRSAYRACSEILTHAGLVDAYFHPQENPLSPLSWAAAARDAGLQFHGEWPPAHRPEDHSRTLDAWLPELLESPVRNAEWFPLWKLDLLDALLELGGNPVLTWIKHPPKTAPKLPRPDSTFAPRGVGDLPVAADRVRMLLAIPRVLNQPVTIETLIARMRAQSPAARYPGLRLQDYPDQ